MDYSIEAVQQRKNYTQDILRGKCKLNVTLSSLKVFYDLSYLLTLLKFQLYGFYCI